MNYLIILLLGFLLLSKKSQNVSNILNGINLESISPVLETFGVNSDLLNAINSPQIKDYLSGNGNIKDLLPLLTPLLKDFLTKKSSSFSGENVQDFTAKSEYLSPIKDIADESVLTTLGNYFN